MPYSASYAVRDVVMNLAPLLDQERLIRRILGQPVLENEGSHRRLAHELRGFELGELCDKIHGVLYVYRIAVKTSSSCSIVAGISV